MFERLIKKKLKKLRKILPGASNVEKDLLPLEGEKIPIKKKKKV